MGISVLVAGVPWILAHTRLRLGAICYELQATQSSHFKKKCPTLFKTTHGL